MLETLAWNNWFYAGDASFLQSSVQEISLQTTVGGGIGRYLKKHQSDEHLFARRSRLAEYSVQTVLYRSGHTTKYPPQSLSQPRSRSSNSKKRIWISLLPSFRRSPSPDASISIRMRRTTSSSSTISRGTSHSTEVGTIILPRRSPAATMGPVRGLSWTFGNR